VLDAKNELVTVSNDDYIAVHRRWLSLRDHRDNSVIILVTILVIIRQKLQRRPLSFVNPCSSVRRTIRYSHVLLCSTFSWPYRIEHAAPYWYSVLAVMMTFMIFHVHCGLPTLLVQHFTII